MSGWPIGRQAREAVREMRADAAAEAAMLFGRTITCESPHIEYHATCYGKVDPRVCSCECHDDVTPPRTSEAQS